MKYELPFERFLNPERITLPDIDIDFCYERRDEVIDYVKKKFPAIDWGAAKAVEPRPYIINSVLNWMLSVTPSDNAGISYTVFVNSWNNEVTSFDTDEGVGNFINKAPIADQNEKISPENRKSKLIEEIEERLKELKELIKQ